jgi:hypothetical protein
MLSDFSRTGATALPADESATEPSVALPEAEPDYESAFQPFAQRDLADTASLLRELSSLGFEDEPPAPSSPSPSGASAGGHGAGPNTPRPSTTTSAQQKKKRGLFGR